MKISDLFEDAALSSDAIYTVIAEIPKVKEALEIGNPVAALNVLMALPSGGTYGFIKERVYKDVLPGTNPEIAKLMGPKFEKKFGFHS